MGAKSGVNMSNDNQARTLLAENWYVIKVIDTQRMQKDGALEALMECELLANLVDCNFIVGYFDSFIEDTKINIIMENCNHGDLFSYIRKQH
jgi:serine/threonine protein kinase